MKTSSFLPIFIKYLVFSVVVVSLAFGGLAFGQPNPASGGSDGGGSDFRQEVQERDIVYTLICAGKEYKIFLTKAETVLFGVGGEYLVGFIRSELNRGYELLIGLTDTEECMVEKIEPYSSDGGAQQVQQTESLFRRVLNRILDFILGKPVFFDLVQVNQAKVMLEEASRAVNEGDVEKAVSLLMNAGTFLTQAEDNQAEDNKETEKLKQAVKKINEAISSGDQETLEKSFTEARFIFAKTINNQVEEQNEALVEINDANNKVKDALQRVNLAVVDYTAAVGRASRDDKDMEETEPTIALDSEVKVINIRLIPVQDPSEVQKAVEEYNNEVNKAARLSRVAKAYTKQVLGEDFKNLVIPISSPKSSEDIADINNAVIVAENKLADHTRGVYVQNEIVQEVATENQIITKLIDGFTLVKEMVSELRNFEDLQEWLMSLRITSSTEVPEILKLILRIFTDKDEFLAETTAKVNPREARPAEARISEDLKPLLKNIKVIIKIQGNGGFVVQQSGETTQDN